MSDKSAPTEAEDSPESTAGADASRRRLFRRDWDQIITLAKEGVPVDKIAKTFKVGRSTIYQGLKRHGIRISAYTPTAEQAVTSKAQEELLKRIRETKEQDYLLTQQIQRRTLKIIADCDRDKIPYGAQIDNFKALKIAIDTVRAGTENKWRILGLDRDNAETDRELPELPILDLGPEQERALRDRQALDAAWAEGDGEEEAESEEPESDEDVEEDFPDEEEST